MANNYTLFSFSIDLSSKEERRWFLAAKAFLEKDKECDVADEIISSYDGYKEDIFCGRISFTISDSEVIICSEDSGDAALAAATVQAYLKRFHTDETVLGFTGALTCDKPRVNEFGGFVYAITKDTIIYKDTHDLFYDLKKIFIV